MKISKEIKYEDGKMAITYKLNTTGGVELKYKDDNGNLAYFTPSEAVRFIKNMESVMQENDCTMVDTMTEYGYVDVEKNGKKGGIIL